MGIFDEMIDSDYDFVKESDNRINRDTKRGTPKLEDNEKTYNIWLKHHSDQERMRPDKFMDESFVSGSELERVIYEISCTAEFFNIEFNKAVIISDSQYVSYFEDDKYNLQSKLNRWYFAIKVVSNAFNETPIKLQNAIDTLLSIDADVPKELTLSVWVRENYGENQKQKALTYAFNKIFPNIKHKPTIKIIVENALNSHK